MRKFIIAAVTVATLAVPAVSMADAPNASLVPTNSNSQGSSIGQASSAIKQNGQFISGNNGIVNPAPWQDQTTYPGSRADQVPALLGHTS